jgi:hypothetical protein
MSIEHQRLLARIANHEEEKQVEPVQQMTIIPNLSSVIESSGEYMEDPKGILARDASGRLIRMKLKVSLSFKAIAGDNSGSILKNVQVQVTLPSNVFAEQTVFRYAELNFGKSSTPPVVQLYLYPTIESVPLTSEVSITATYTQVANAGQQ